MNSNPTNKKQVIALLGSTGSIGTQTLDVIASNPDRFEVYALTANNNIDLLIEQAKRFKPEVVVIGNDQHYLTLKEALKEESIKVFAGAQSIAEVVVMEPITTVVTAMVLLGFALNGKPYMGIGKNMAYRRELFFEAKGYSEYLNLQRGEDDLFINKLANKQNTRVETDPNATIQLQSYYSKEWKDEKKNYLLTSKHYKGPHCCCIDEQCQGYDTTC